MILVLNSDGGSNCVSENFEYHPCFELEHRAYISEEIQDLQKRKEEVLLREFLEER